MAEVVGLIASIITFVDVAYKVVSRLHEYHSLSKDAPEVFRNVSTQLPLIIDIMGRIEKGCKDGSIAPEAQESLLQIVRQSLSQINVLKELVDRVVPVPLDSALQRRRKALRYLRERKRIATITTSLEDYKSTLTLHFSQISYDVQQQSKKLIYSSWLKPLELSHILTPRVKGTCDWIWEEGTFKEWFTASNPPFNERLLRICGAQGCGKSVLASSMFQDMRKKGCHALFFPFSGIHHDRQELNSMARTFLGQSLQYLSYQQVAPIMDKLMLQDPFGSPEIMDAFEEALKSIPTTTYCVIDGVDESGESSSVILNWALDTLKSAEHLRIVLIGRPHSLKMPINTDTHLIEISATSNDCDVSKFIDAEVDKLLHLTSSSLRDSVTQLLRDRSDGIFLWVRLMIGSLKDAATKGEMMDRLRRSPRGLEQIYALLFQSLAQNLTESQLQRARKAFSFIVAACRSLTVDELRYMFALQCSGNLEDNLPIDASVLLPGVCGDLVSITEGRVQLIHTSIKDFLIRPLEAWGDNEEAATFRVDLHETHQTFSDSSLRYISMDSTKFFPLDTPADVERLETERPFFKYSNRYAFSHLMEIGVPKPATIERIKQFVESEQSDWCLEYITFLMVLDPLSMLLYELDFLATTFFSETDLKDKWGNKLAKWLAKRIKGQTQSGVGTLEVDQIQSLIVVRDENEWVPRDAKHNDTSLSDPVNQSASVAQIMHQLSEYDVLPLAGKAASLLGLLSQLKQSKHLVTDPLKLLLKMLLQASHSIPVYVLQTIGIFYDRLGKEDDALEVYRAALKKVEHLNSFAKFSILEDIGDILERKEQWEAAEAVYRQSLAGKQELFGPDHLHTRTTLQYLSYPLLMQNKYDEHERVLRLLLKGLEKNLGPCHPKTLDILCRIGETLYDQERFREAEEVHRKVVRERTRALSSTHADTIYSMTQLAACLGSLDEPREAEVMFRQAMIGAEKTSGKKSLRALDIAISVAVSLQTQRKHAEAVEICRQAVGGLVDLLGEDHSTVLECKALLVSNLARLNDFSMVEEMHTRVMKIMQESQASSSTPDLDTLYWISYSTDVHEIRGDHQKAEQIYRFVLEGREKRLKQSPPHFTIRNSIANLRNCLLNQGKYEEAIPLARRWIVEAAKVIGNDNIRIWKAHASLGQTLVWAGDFEEGERVICEALRSIRKAGELGEDFVAYAFELGTLLGQNARDKAAESIFRLGMETPEMWELDHYSAWLCLVNSGISLYYQDCFDEAERDLKRAIQESKNYTDYDWELPRSWLMRLWRQRRRISNGSSDSQGNPGIETRELRRIESWSGFDSECYDLSDSWDRASIV